MIFKCKLCNDFKTKDALTFYHHIRNKHSISTKDYYDKYMKKEGEGFCKYCHKPTNFNDISHGYREFCSPKCASIGTIDRKIQTCLKNNGTEFPMQSKKVRNKCEKTWIKDLGVDNPSKSKKIKKKKEKTCLKHFGVPCSFMDEGVKKKSKESLLKHFGVDHPMKSKIVVNKIINTNMERRGVACVLQDEKVKNKIKKTNVIKYGFENASQSKVVKEKIRKNHFDEETMKKMFSKRMEENNGYLSKSEYEFSKLLKYNRIKFKSEYLIRDEEFSHCFDFAIFEKDKLKCLVEIDGRYFHGNYRDFNGVHSKDSRDYLRWTIVPKKVKFLVIDDNKLFNGIEELKRILPMKYKDWKKEMIRSIPKNIEKAIPKFSDTRLLGDWRSLCKYPYRNGAFIGKSILLHFCRSHWDKLKDDWLTIRKTLYKSPCSTHNVLEGLDTFQNPSKLRRKYKKKYKGCKEVVIKHHSPEKMLAICSLGKTYISKEPLDSESVKISKYLDLDVYYDKTNK